MKTLLFILGLMIPFCIIGQIENEENITISELQEDDLYQTGKNIQLIAPVFGDVTVAGSSVSLKDTIHQDLLVTGGEIFILGYVADDIRAAGGKIIIDAEVGDDVIVAGGQVTITKNAVIGGNLINFSGNIEMNGKVMGMIRSNSGNIKMNGLVEGDAHIAAENIQIDGEIRGTSKIIAKNIIIGDNAKFHDTVTYWNEENKLDFQNSLIGTTATFEKSLAVDEEKFSWRGFNISSFWFWMLYLPAIFLILLLLNWPFHKFFSKAAADWSKKFWSSMGFGLIFILGIPTAVLISFVIIIGIPIGLFLIFLYIFSLLFGHLVTALLLSYYADHKQRTHRKPIFILLIAVLFAVIFRLIIFIPVLGIVLAVIINSIGYGLFISRLLQRKVSA